MSGLTIAGRAVQDLVVGGRSITQLVVGGRVIYDTTAAATPTTDPGAGDTGSGTGDTGTSTPTTPPATAPTQPSAGSFSNLDYSGAVRAVTFTDPAQWTKVSVTGAGAVTATTTDPADGTTTALRFTTDHYGTDDVWGHTLPAPIDLTDAYLRMPLRSPNRGILRVELFLAESKAKLDTDGACHYTMVATANNTTRSEWAFVGMDPVFMYGTSDVDLSKIGYVQLRTRTYDTSQAAVFDLPYFDVQPKTSPVALCSLWYDDARPDAYTSAFQRMKEYDFPGVLAVEPGRINNGSSLTTAQIDEMVAAGWEVAVHCYTEHTTLDGDALAADLDKSIAYIASHETWGTPVSFAYWGNPGPLTPSAANRQIIMDRFADGRWNSSKGANGMPETLPPQEPSMTRSWLQGSNDTVEEWIGQLERAIKAKGFFEITMHAPPGALLTDFLAYLKGRVDDGVVKVVTKREAMGLAGSEEARPVPTLGHPYWTTKLSPNAPLAPTSDLFVANMLAQKNMEPGGSPIDAYTGGIYVTQVDENQEFLIPIWRVPRDTPRIKVAQVRNGSYRTKYYLEDDYSKHYFQDDLDKGVPIPDLSKIPSGTLEPSGHDGSVIIICDNGKGGTELWEMYKFREVVAGSEAEGLGYTFQCDQGGYMADMRYHPGFWAGTGDGLKPRGGDFGNSAIGMSYAGALLTWEDYQADEITHPLALQLPLTGSPDQAVYAERYLPATRYDRQKINIKSPDSAVNAYRVPEGVRFRLPAAKYTDAYIDSYAASKGKSSPSSGGSTPAVLAKVMRCLRDFGMILSDTAGVVALSVEAKKTYGTTYNADKAITWGDFGALLPWVDFVQVAVPTVQIAVKGAGSTFPEPVAYDYSLAP